MVAVNSQRHPKAKGVVYEEDADVINRDTCIQHEAVAEPYKHEVIWQNVIIFISLHIVAVYGFKIMLFDVKWLTIGWSEYEIVEEDFD